MQLYKCFLWLRTSHPTKRGETLFSVAVRLLLPNLQPHSYTLLHIRRLIDKQYNQVKSERKRRKKGTAAKSWSRPESSRGRQGNCMPCQRVGAHPPALRATSDRSSRGESGAFQVSPLSGLQSTPAQRWHVISLSIPCWLGWPLSAPRLSLSFFVPCCLCLCLPLPSPILQSPQGDACSSSSSSSSSC